MVFIGFIGFRALGFNRVVQDSVYEFCRSFVQGFARNPESRGLTQKGSEGCTRV